MPINLDNPSHDDINSAFYRNSSTNTRTFSQNAGRGSIDRKVSEIDFSSMPRMDARGLSGDLAGLTPTERAKQGYKYH